MYVDMAHYNGLTILTEKLLSRRANSFYSIFHSGSLFTLFTCFYNTRKDLTKSVQEEDQFLCILNPKLWYSKYYLHGYGLYYDLQGVKWLMKRLYFFLLSRRKITFSAKFQVLCLHRLPIFTWLWPAL